MMYRTTAAKIATTSPTRTKGQRGRGTGSLFASSSSRSADSPSFGDGSSYLRCRARFGFSLRSSSAGRVSSSATSSAIWSLWLCKEDTWRDGADRQRHHHDHQEHCHGSEDQKGVARR